MKIPPKADPSGAPSRAFGPATLVPAAPQSVKAPEVAAAVEDGAVSRMLSEMPNTRLLPLVIYGAEDSAVLPAGLADRSRVRCVAGHGVPEIRAAIEALLSD